MVDETVPIDARDGGGGDADLRDKFVVLGVSGSIAAYKAAEICRRLIDAGAYVVPVLTLSATKFIGSATLTGLASEPAKTELFSDRDPIPHTRLGRAADLVIVAPASASTIGRFAAGIASDLLSATLLCTTAPVMICPAMHTEMWNHDAVQENVQTLSRRGVIVVPPESGRLAGGDIGSGRLAEPAQIVERARALFANRVELSGVRFVVTAGGTREPIDPVRFISNRSSGKQGHAIAAEANRRGAYVTLITTVDLEVDSRISVVRVETAAEMHDEVVDRADSADVVVMVAAVADFRPAKVGEQKWKKRDGIPSIELEETTDILSELGDRRRDDQVIVGFAAETTDAIGEGIAKYRSKNLDLIVVNDVSLPGVGFGHETNAVTILDRDGGQQEYPLAPKSVIAAAVIDAIVSRRAISESFSDSDSR